MKTFRIIKKSGTYAELLEAYGVANLLQKIFDALNETELDITLSDYGCYYEVNTSEDITECSLSSLPFFYPFIYIKSKETDTAPKGVGIFFDYPKQQQIKKDIKKINNDQNLNQKEKQNRIQKMLSKNPIDINYDVYSQIADKNNYVGFKKLYDNFNEASFLCLIKSILNYYSCDDNLFDIEEDSLVSTDTVTAVQLYNPSLGQGVNKTKTNGINRMNKTSSWISETMKTSGGISDMICQLIKVGSNSYDLKIFVPEYKKVNSGYKSTLSTEFKKRLKGNTPIKFDVLSVLSLTQILLENNEFSGRRRKVRDIINGLHSVYQKDMGQNKAVMNIGFLQLPEFINIGSKEENQLWIDVLKEHSAIIYSLDEDKGAYCGLMKYRDFISDADLNKFFDFVYWYSNYAMSMLSKGQWVELFKQESLNKIFNNMSNKSNNLTEIINNVGFQAIAKAIRKSTVTLQYTPKNARKFDVKYGVAQKLQIKSKSKEDLAEFIGDFIASYNAETARNVEKVSSPERPNVRINELQDFYLLLDTYPSSLIGALLASYGFALEAKSE